MNREILDKILDDHKEWVRTGGVSGKRANLSNANLSYANLSYADLSYADLSHANLRCADLSHADLSYADLCGADLDFSCFPLWCGGLKVHIDDKQAVQLLYHLVRNVDYSKNTSAEMKKICKLESIVGKANEFHRVDECGEIGGGE